jgi:hypothetical protein
MTKDEALKLAKECGATTYTNRHYPEATAVTFSPVAWEKFCEQALAAPVQEPVAWVTAEDVKVFNTVQGESVFLFQKNGKWNVPLYTTPPAAAVQEGRDWSLLEATQESLREHMAEIKRLKEAQPAVPDAITDDSESPEYRAGWNECREVMAEMLKGMK